MLKPRQIVFLLTGKVFGLKPLLGSKKLKWKEYPSLPSVLQSVAAVQFEDKLFFFGGSEDVPSESNGLPVFVFHTKTQSWTITSYNGGKNSNPGSLIGAVTSTVSPNLAYIVNTRGRILVFDMETSTLVNDISLTRNRYHYFAIKMRILEDQGSQRREGLVLGAKGDNFFLDFNNLKDGIRILSSPGHPGKDLYQLV